MVVYLVRCKLNGKGYVGQTIRPFSYRWKEHCREGKGLLDRAILKYGQDNFEHCILAEAHTIDELNALEIFHIGIQNTIHPKGYNLSSGGSNHTQHPDTRRRASERMSNWKPSEKMKASQLRAVKGVPKSAEHRAKISAAHLGMRHSPESIAKMIATKAKGKSHEQ